jgi:hypothetical protein
MDCPACGYQWDTSKGFCQRCGFRIKTTAPFGSSAEPEGIWSGTALSGDVSSAGPAHALSAQKNLQDSVSPSRGPSGALSPTRLSGSLPQKNEPFAAPSPGRGPSGALSPTRLSGPLPQRNTPDATTSPLKPGALLRQKRYRVQEFIARQAWHSGIYEATWIGRDLQRQKQVKICEVVIPEALNVATLPVMQTATMALLSVRDSQHLLTLEDAFKDLGRSFFVFAWPAGETLSARIQRLRQPFPEQMIVNFCLQMTSVLESFSQKSPPLVHGLISPDHITMSYDGSRYLLSDFSVLVSGRATRLLSGLESSYLSPYAPPEFTSNVLDPRNDLYAVLATAYYLATASVPSRNNRGLHPMPHQRYQQPAQLRQDLLALSSQQSRENAQRQSGARSSSELNNRLSFSSFSETLTPASPPSSSTFNDEMDVLLPAPETLPPLRTGYERLEASAMLLVILVSLGIIVGLSHFHV